MGYILFSSDTSIKMSVSDPQWDGTIEYSYDNQEWNEWYGEQIINNVIYMRGINNTVISNYKRWDIVGENVKCQGNIENLLNYKLVINNIYPKMHIACFARMFEECKALIEAPHLSSLELSPSCYYFMFSGCSNLCCAPNISARQSSSGSFFNMFQYCTSLIMPPQLFISKLSDDYIHMFYGCSSLISTPIFANLLTAKMAFEVPMFLYCSNLQTINVNNKSYDISILKLF